MNFIQSVDAQFVLFIQDHLRCGILNAIMVFFSALGTWGLIWIVAAIALILTKKYRFTGIMLLVCLTVTWCINDLALKNLIQRPRPFITLPELKTLVPLESSFSFPSGHSSTSFASAYVITRSNGKRWAWVYAVASLIALSRIYVGMHYPTDVLGGIIIGTILAAATYALTARPVMSLAANKSAKK